jgi:hypothetical protein
MVGVVDCSAIQTTGSNVELVPRVSLRHRILNEVLASTSYPDVTGLFSTTPKSCSRLKIRERDVHSQLSHIMT